MARTANKSILARAVNEGERSLISSRRKPYHNTLGIVANTQILDAQVLLIHLQVVGLVRKVASPSCVPLYDIFVCAVKFHHPRG